MKGKVNREPYFISASINRNGEFVLGFTKLVSQLRLRTNPIYVVSVEVPLLRGFHFGEKDNVEINSMPSVPNKRWEEIKESITEGNLKDKQKKSKFQKFKEKCKGIFIEILFLANLKIQLVEPHTIPAPQGEVKPSIVAKASN